MGLDMYLYLSNTFSSKYGRDEEKEAENVKAVATMMGAEDFLKEDDLQFADVKLQVAYWRKANAIHKFFVDTCANGVDECQDIYVPSEKLMELKNRCEKVLENHDLASELLPSQSGFFFGSTDYDEWYFEDLENTVKQISKVIEKATNSHLSVCYRASW